MDSFDLGRGRWLGPALLVLFVALLELGAVAFFPQLARWPGRFVLAAIVLAALGITSLLVFRSVRRMQRELEKRNQELQALQQANLDIYGEVSLEAVLQRVVEQAANLLDSRFGALSIVGEEGRVEQFITTGLEPEERDRIGEPPVGRGLLGVPLHQGEVLRVDNVAADPRSVGMPPHHPGMSSLLAVPISTEHPIRANLYVAEKRKGGAFGASDEATLRRFGDQAALAIEKAFLHRQLRTLAVGEERARIAREMHDGLAQVLAYVNTKAQAVREYVVAGKKEEAVAQLEQLAAAARDVLTEVREGILALRTRPSSDRSFQEVVEEYLAKWREQSGILVTAEIPDQLRLDDAVELQLLRIIQEALSNVRKHSGAHHASVIIEVSREGLSAVIDDRGIGFDAGALERKGSPRFGLAIMRERAESVSGTVTIDAAPGRGTTVRVDLPAA